MCDSGVPALPELPFSGRERVRDAVEVWQELQMAVDCLRLSLLDLEQLWRIKETAVRVVEGYGLRVRGTEVPKATAQAGLTLSDGQIRFHRAAIEAAQPEPIVGPEPEFLPGAEPPESS